MKKLDKIFNPRTIAVIGASEEDRTVGKGLCENLLRSGWENVYMINPFQEKVFGRACLKKITDIKEKVDLAVIAVPAKIVPSAVKECCDKKVGGMAIVSNGFSEDGPAGKKLEAGIVEMARNANIPIVGPNCLGIINAVAGMNASFSPVSPKAGNIAMLSQSGALLDSMLCSSAEENFGFSKVISYGNESDLNLCDFLEYLRDDKDTDVISIYFEGLRDGRRFMKIAQEVSKIKPIVAIKSGRSAAGKSAALTHTGSLAGDYPVCVAAMKQSGVILVDTLEELFDVSKSLAWQPRCNNGIGIVTNGGGLGVLSVDYCAEEGIIVPHLKPKTEDFLAQSKTMERVKARNNPFDVIGDALADRYEVAIEAMLKQDDIFSVLVISTPQIMTEHMENAKIMVKMKRKYPHKALVACFVGGSFSTEAVRYLEDNHVPNYADPKRAVKSIRKLIL